MKTQQVIWQRFSHFILEKNFHFRANIFHFSRVLEVLKCWYLLGRLRGWPNFPKCSQFLKISQFTQIFCFPVFMNDTQITRRWVWAFNEIDKIKLNLNVESNIDFINYLCYSQFEYLNNHFSAKRDLQLRIFSHCKHLKSIIYYFVYIAIHLRTICLIWKFSLLFSHSEY